MSLPAGGQPSRENNAPRGLGPPAGPCRQTEPDRTKQLALAPFQPGTLSLAMPSAGDTDRPSQVHCLVVQGRQAYSGGQSVSLSQNEGPQPRPQKSHLWDLVLRCILHRGRGGIRTFFFTTSKQRECNGDAERGTATWGRGGRAAWTRCGAKHETRS